MVYENLSENFSFDKIKYNSEGLVPVIAQDYLNKDVLMLAYANKEAIEKTIETGYVHYFSRSRQKLWKKGETSNHFQLVKEMRFDCDRDTLLIFVEQIEYACHTGSRSCFFETIYKAQDTNAPESDTKIVQMVYDTIMDRKANPVEGSYTNYLFNNGIDKILKKVGEETTEVIIAAKNCDKKEITYELSDVIYHLSVMMVEEGVSWQDVYTELNKRYGMKPRKK